MASTLKQTTLNPKQNALTEVKFEEIKFNHGNPTGPDEMLTQLDALIKAEDYDDEFHAPTDNAISKMRGFLEGARSSLTIDFPLGTIYTDGEGGLRLEWIRPDRELRLVISASPQGRNYIYHEQGDEYAADYSPTVSELGRWLNWLEDSA